MAVKGIFASDAGGLGERNPNSLANVILKAERGYGAPLFALSSGIKNKSTNGSTHVTWYEESIMICRTLITQFNDPQGNIITVEDSSWIHENMIFMIEPTGEYVMVLGVQGNILTVQRGMGGTQQVAIPPVGTAPALQLISTAFEEGSERPTAIATNPYPRTNVVQIFRKSWEITGTAMAINYVTGDRKPRNKQEAGMQHAEDIERALIWGKTHQGVVNNKPFRTMDGMLSQLRTNIFLAPAAGLNRRVLTDYCERLFAVNVKNQPTERITFVGNNGIRAVNEIVWRYGFNGGFSITESTKVFGLDVSTFKTPFGNLTLLMHPLMNENPLWSSQMYSLHPGAMTIYWLRETFHQGAEDGAQTTNGAASELRDAQAGVFTSELTCSYAQEQTGAIMTGILPDHFEP